jgi:hypothetical protein
MIVLNVIGGIYGDIAACWAESGTLQRGSVTLQSLAGIR